MVAWAWLACAGPEGDKPPPDGTPTGLAPHSSVETDPPPLHTGAPPEHTGEEVLPHSVPDGELLAACAVTAANALRVQCDIRVGPRQPVEVTWQKADGTGPVRTRRLDDAVAHHVVTLWNFAPDADYVVHVATLDGSVADDEVVHTGTLPREAQVLITTTGTSSAGRFLTTSPCQGGAAIAWDPATAEVIWYQGLTGGPYDFLEGVQWTDDDTVLGIGAGSVIEVGWEGNIVRELLAGVDLPLRAHHDAFKRAGLTYVVFQELVQIPQDVFVDGFYVFDSLGLSWEWHLADLQLPTTDDLGRNGPDWSHANGVWADDQGDVVFSLRHLSGVISIEGDPLDPAFGQPHWVLVGDADSTLVGDVALTSLGLPGFAYQHNPHFLPSGQLTLFDNRVGLENSRILDLTVDPLARTATVDREWPLPGDVYASGHCDFQGSAWRTDAGNPVATCAPFRLATEFDATTGAVAWTGNVECTSGPSSYVPRFVPLPP